MHGHPFGMPWCVSVFFLLVSHLVLRVKGLLRLQQSLAGIDNLTGLVNGRIFYQRLGDEAPRAQPSSPAPESSASLTLFLPKKKATQIPTS